MSSYFLLILLGILINFVEKGKKVVAFSWPEPQFSGTMTPNLIEAGKFAWLEGDVSEFSNANGTAIFKNLTVFLFFFKYYKGIYQFFSNKTKDQRIQLKICVYLFCLRWNHHSILGKTGPSFRNFVKYFHLLSLCD